jgi:hypothetical protein
MTPEEIAAWREGRTETMRLACGLTVTLRKVSLLDLAAAGDIPTPLIGEVEAILNDGLRIDVGRLKETMGAVDLVVKAAVVEPTLTDAPGNGQIAVSELPGNDRLSIYTWAHKEASAFARFPERQSQRTESARPGDDVPEPTEPDLTD